MQTIITNPSGAKTLLIGVFKISEMKTDKKGQYYCFVSRIGNKEDEYYPLGATDKEARQNYDVLVLAWCAYYENVANG